MPVLVGATLLVGAALLFFVEPMIARRVLPRFGGSPAVWNTCMVFFQAALLAGYAYVQVASKWLRMRRQVVLHGCLLVLPLWTLWADAARDAPSPISSSNHPTAELLVLLTTTVGPLFFVVAATAPLLQSWFAATGHPQARDPYFLYGVSNLGSLVGLLAYPFVIEPNLRLAEQELLRDAGYLVLATLTLACAVAAWRSARLVPSMAEAGKSIRHHRPVGLRLRLRWVALAFVPSSLLLGVTTSMTTDIAPIPLLWVVPLALYLLSFVLVFARRPMVSQAASVRTLRLAIMVLVPVMAAGLVQPFWIPLHLLTFFAAALVCHGELARLRPGVGDLPAFYLAIAAGGVLGGIANALVAPLAFDRVAEYPLGVFLACLCLPGVGRETTWRGRASEGLLPLIIGVVMAGLVCDVGGLAGSALGPFAVMLASGLAVLVAATARARPLRFALGVAAVLLAGGLSEGVDGRVLHRERTFFGVLRVTEAHEGGEQFHRLFHGTTLHGQQRVSAHGLPEPLTYYHRSGPIGQVFEVVQSSLPRRAGPSRVIIVGLGAGSLAAYARDGELWTFYEIDPAVVRIARDPRAFTFLRDSRAETLDVDVGDARLRLHQAVDRDADLIVLDAFSSDAIPTHLLTREAMRLYQAKLADGGLIALHLSNRTINLVPVVGLLARDAGLIARVRRDERMSPEERRAGKSPSLWAVLAARPSDLGELAGDRRWQVPEIEHGDRVWTDDYVNVVGHIVLRPSGTVRGNAP